MSKGQEKERQISAKFAAKTAVLVSSTLLRRIGAGQVDFCYVENGVLTILEVKSSYTGMCSYQRAQRSRLTRSAVFLSEVSSLPAKIILI